MELTHSTDPNNVMLIQVQGKPEGEFLPAFETLVEPGRYVVLDLAAAVAFKGNDLEDLVWARNRCVEEGGGFVLANLPSDLVFILRLLELDKFFDIQQTVTEGALALKQQQTGMTGQTRRIVISRGELIRALEPYTVDPEDAARRQIEEIKTSMRYVAPTEQRIALLEYLLAQGTEAIDAGAAAKALAQDATEVEKAIAQLSALQIIVRRGGAPRFFPKPQAHVMIQDIVTLWAEADNREAMMRWANQAD